MACDARSHVAIAIVRSMALRGAKRSSAEASTDGQYGPCRSFRRHGDGSDVCDQPPEPADERWPSDWTIPFATTAPSTPDPRLVTTQPLRQHHSRMRSSVDLVALPYIFSQSSLLTPDQFIRVARDRGIPERGSTGRPSPRACAGAAPAGIENDPSHSP